MKVLMLGWEFPPYISGGLGTACFGLTKALNGIGVDVLFVLPRPVKAEHTIREVREVGTEPEPQPTLQVTESESEPEPAPIVADTPASPVAPHSVPAEPVKHTWTEEHREERHKPPRYENVAHPYTFEHVKFRVIDAMLSPYESPKQYVERLAEVQRGEHVETRVHQDPPEIVIQKIEKTAWSQNAPQPGAQTSAPAQSVQTQPAHVPPPPSAGPKSITKPDEQYAGDMFGETRRYADLAVGVTQEEEFDVVHAHDWMTFPAGIAVAAATGKPLVVHVHSTEYDRNGVKAHPLIREIERRGMELATRVIAVSDKTRRTIVERFGISAYKVSVVYNAVDQMTDPLPEDLKPHHNGEKTVLYLGRITHQKGPEYFLAAAKKVLEIDDSVKFIMAGGGDLAPHIIEQAARMGIGHKVLFTGFLEGRDVQRAYAMADLYVMPSVSEPFGIAPLEALSQNVPVLISKQSGVSEVLKNALKADFWDTNDIADKILAVLRRKPLAKTLRDEGSREVRKFIWQQAAEEVQEIYEQIIGNPARDDAEVA